MRGNAVRRALKVKCRFSRETIISVESGKTRSASCPIPFSAAPPPPPRSAPPAGPPQSAPALKPPPAHCTHTQRLIPPQKISTTRGGFPTPRPRHTPPINAPPCPAETPHDAPTITSLITMPPSFPAKQPSAAHRNSTPKKQQKNHRKVIPQQRQCKRYGFVDIFKLKTKEK